MNSILIIIIILASYLIGSIPIGYILVKHLTGQNILKLGSGNIGSTNVKRIAGKRNGIITQLLDMLKGLLPVSTYLYFNYDLNLSYYQNIIFDSYIYYIAFASILGHDFSIFLKFKGGKGVNTTLGASILIAPIPILISVIIYFIIKWLFKFVSLGSMSLAITMVVSEFIIYGINSTFYYLLLCMILIIILHYENIHRLLKHQELPSHNLP